MAFLPDDRPDSLSGKRDFVASAFGDWLAVRAAYPKLEITVPQRAGFRDPDAIKGGTWEAMERVLQRKGYFKTGLRKMELAPAVAVEMDPARNRSASFGCLRDVLGAL